MEESAQRHPPAVLYPRGKDARYPLYRRLGGPQSRSGHRGYKKNRLTLPGIEPQSPGRPVHSHMCRHTRLEAPIEWLVLTVARFHLLCVCVCVGGSEIHALLCGCCSYKVSRKVVSYFSRLILSHTFSALFFIFSGTI
jgi:hypothetical protein